MQVHSQYNDGLAAQGIGGSVMQRGAVNRAEGAARKLPSMLGSSNDNQDRVSEAYLPPEERKKGRSRRTQDDAEFGRLLSIHA